MGCSRRLVPVLKLTITVCSRNIWQFCIKSPCRLSTFTTSSVTISKESDSNSRLRSNKSWKKWRSLWTITKTISYLNWCIKSTKKSTAHSSAKSKITPKVSNTTSIRNSSKWSSYTHKPPILNLYPDGLFSSSSPPLSCVFFSAQFSTFSTLCPEVSHLSFRSLRTPA